MESSDDAIIGKTLDGIIVSWNKGAEKIFGYSANEAIGKPITILIPLDLLQEEKTIIEEIKAGNHVLHYETVRLTKDGTRVNISAGISPVRDKDGNITGASKTARGITDRLQAEQTKSLLSSIIDSSDDAIVSKTLDGVITTWNKGAEKIFGYTAKEIIGKNIALLIPTELQHEEKMIIGEITKGNSVSHYETLRVTKMGTKVNISVTISPIKDNMGKIIGASKIARDISERINAQKRIQASEKQYKDLIHGLPVGIYTCDAEGNIELYNGIAAKIWGRTPEPGKDKWCGSWKMYNPDGTRMPHDECPMAVSVKSGRMVSKEVIVERPDGVRFTVIPYPQPVFDLDGKVTGAINTIVDVTEQVEARKKIEATERRFRSLVEKSPSPICILLGEEMRVELANDPMLTIWNVGLEAIGKPLAEIIPEMKEQAYARSLQNVLRNNTPHYGTEELIYFKRKNGVIQNMYFNCAFLPYKENGGAVSGVVVLATDITEQVTARKKIEVQNELFRDMLMTAPGFVATLIGPDHVYGLVNAQYQSLFGKRKIRGKPLLEALPELAGQGFDELLDDVYKTGKPFVGIEVPMMLARDEGREPELGYFNFSYQPMYDENKSIFSILVFGYEITEEVKAKNKNLEGLEAREKELVEAVAERTQKILLANKTLEKKNEELAKINQELESFSYVASHDLQEPLRKIQTFASRVTEKESQNLSDVGRDYVARMSTAAARMRQLIDDLLSFSRLSATERKFEQTDLNDLLVTVKSELRERIAEKNAMIEVSSLPEINVIPFQFRQLMLNIIGNALKFSSAERRLHVRIESEIVKEESIDFKPDSLMILSPEKMYWHISVSDNGIGFDPRFNDRIFQVFQRLHSQEGLYSGTGIGLAIVKKIVENHRGIITATGEVDKGSTFNIYIPVD